MKILTKPRIKKINIDREAYLGLKKLIICDDIENKKVALLIINGIDFNKNKIPILLLYRAYQKNEIWETFAKRILKKIKTQYSIINYISIYDIIKKEKLVDSENIYIQDFKEYNLKNMQSVYPYIKNLIIEI